MKTLVRSLGVVLLVCGGVRLAAWLVAPLLPALAVLCFLVAIGLVAIRRS